MSKFTPCFSEYIHDDLRVQYKIKEILYSQQSAFQKVEVVETKGFGRMLFNDNIAMVSEKDEFIYHDMLTHVPLFTHPSPQNVLVIGGGDGGTIREVLRHSSVKKATLVEIDECVVKACEEFMPQLSSALKDKKCHVLFEDGAKFVEETDEKFDIILVDSTDPLGPSVPLFNTKFYKNVYRILNEDGIVVSQAESPYYYEKEQTNLLRTIKSIFDNLYLYKYSNLIYPGGMWCFAMGTKKYNPLEDSTLRRSSLKDFNTDYYTSSIHRESFVLPAFLNNRLKDLITNS
ncbi:spermidine synthase [PVC group bacterium (ex Bugula neritina AB1)]|nr:spermidine synthase [PVC group bacterium (ex Bugula neritina AB1)]